MANSTGQILVNDARSRAGYQTSQFVTDTEVLGWVNDAATELYDLMNMQEESVYATPYVFALPDPILAATYTAQSLGTPPVNYAQLPANLDRIQGLDFNNAGAVGGAGTQGQVTIHMFSFQNRNDRSQMLYKAMGNIAGVEILMVIPPERSPGNYQLWYIPMFVPLTLSTTLDNVQQRWAEFIGNGAAMRILAKARRDFSQQMERQNELRARIATMAQGRDSEAEQGGTASNGHYTSGWPYTGSWGRY